MKDKAKTNSVLEILYHITTALSKLCMPANTALSTALTSRNSPRTACFYSYFSYSYARNLQEIEHAPLKIGLLKSPVSITLNHHKCVRVIKQ